MEYFKVIIGKSRIEFSVIFNREKNLYQGLINQKVFFENTDYEVVREAIIKGLSDNTKSEVFH